MASMKWDAKEEGHLVGVDDKISRHPGISSSYPNLRRRLCKPPELSEIEVMRHFPALTRAPALISGSMARNATI
jgi:hypothetical protein